MNLTFQLNKIKRFSWIRLQEMNSHGVMFRWTSEDEYQKKQRYFVTRQALRWDYDTRFYNFILYPRHTSQLYNFFIVRHFVSPRLPIIFNPKHFVLSFMVRMDKMNIFLKSFHLQTLYKLKLALINFDLNL